MKLKYTIDEIKDSIPSYKSDKEPFWCRVFVRRVSIYVTYLLINIGLSANVVSVISYFAAMAGCLLLCVNNPYTIYLAIILLNLWSVLDCVDGNIARCTKKSSLVGEFFDALGGYIISAFSMIGIGVAAYHTAVLPEQYKICLVIISAFGGACDILYRLIYQKYSNNMMRLEFDRIGEKGIKVELDDFYKSNGRPSSLKKMFMAIDYELGIGGDELLFLIIATILNRLDVFLVIYSVYRMGGLLIVLILYTKKMFVYEKKYL